MLLKALLIALILIAYILVAYAIAEFLVWKALRDWEAQKKLKPIKHINVRR